MKITVITVSLNNVATVTETIESVIAQNYPEVEHIVIDGGSADGTVEKIQHYADHIDYWISEPDKGIYDAMNKGIARASGEIIGFLNADDLYAHHNVLAKIADVLQDPRIAACYSDLVYVDPENLNKIVRYWRSSAYQDGNFSKGWCPPHPTFWVRRSVYEKYGGFDLNYALGNDIELMMRLLARHGIRAVYIPDITVKMRVGGVSNKSIGNIVTQNAEILRAARNNNIQINPFIFILAKILSRLAQFMSRPAGLG